MLGFLNPALLKAFDTMKRISMGDVRLDDLAALRDACAIDISDSALASVAARLNSVETDARTLAEYVSSGGFLQLLAGGESTPRGVKLLAGVGSLLSRPMDDVLPDDVAFIASAALDREVQADEISEFTEFVKQQGFEGTVKDFIFSGSAQRLFRYGSLEEPINEMCSTCPHMLKSLGV